jgi:hypothetical protein
MQRFYSELIKLLPEIVVEYLNLLAIKKEMKSSTLLKEVTLIPEYDNLD